ncbi:hypothetical protein [Longimicrobium sp.]|uniref:hypothetical protein n=1 Tax=Longimicrobium sp. TaxID=2029185 RepID=UPI003B3B65F6
MMQELLPPQAYQGMGASRTRTALVMAVLWGVPMTLFTMLDAEDALEAVLLLLVGVMGALVFGFMWAWTMAFWMGRLQKRIYQGDPRIVPAPPAGDYDYRLACSYMASPALAVGGHLYLGPAAWTFVPHRKNLKRHRAPLTIAITPGTEVQCVEVRLPALARLLVPGPAYRLQVRTAALIATFVTPEPHTVTARLREYLQAAHPFT